MAITPTFPRAATATALSALLGAGALLAAGAATAAPDEHPSCVPGDLDVSVAEIPAPDDGRLFAIELDAKPGVSCQVEGAPSGLTFFNDGAVQDVRVIAPEPGTAQPHTIDEQHPGVTYAATPPVSPHPAPISSITYTLPAGGGITADWPSAIDGPVRIGNIGPQVS